MSHSSFRSFDHARARRLRRALADRRENTAMLFEAVVVDARRADPSEAKAAFERRLDEPAERGEKWFPVAVENGDVKIDVGADEVAVAVP